MLIHVNSDLFLPQNIKQIRALRVRPCCSNRQAEHELQVFDEHVHSIHVPAVEVDKHRMNHTFSTSVELTMKSVPG